MQEFRGEPRLAGKFVEYDEKEQEKIQGLVVGLVVDLNKPDNFDNFQNSITKMFGSFGILPAKDSGWKVRNIEGWRRTYESWHRNHQHADIEVYGSPDGNHPGYRNYANIYVKRIGVPGLNVSVDLVCPGACSLPDTTDFVPPPGTTVHKTNDFYREFEQTVGADFVSGLHTVKKGLKNDTKPKFFLVVNGRQVRLPAEDWSIKLITKIASIHHTRIR